MPVRFPDLPKGAVYIMLTHFPKQSGRIASAVRKDLDKWKGDWDFNAFMGKLFWSKDILKRTGYYHLNSQITKTYTI